MKRMLRLVEFKALSTAARVTLVGAFAVLGIGVAILVFIVRELGIGG